MKKLIFLLAFLISFNQAWRAQSNPTYTAITGVLSGTSQLQTAATLSFSSIGKTLVQPQTLRENNKSARLHFKLDAGNDYIKKSSNWTFTVQVDLTYQFNGASAVSKTLTIDQDHPELLKIDDVLPTVSSTLVTAPLTVTVNSVSIVTTPTTGLVVNFINDNIRLSVKLEREYEVDVRFVNGLMSFAPQINTVSITNRLVTFSWQPNSVDAYPDYELQVLRLYNTNPQYQNDLTITSGNIDWTKALKIETQSYQTSVSLNMAEGTGFYIWRVRPIGNYYDGGIGNIENYGQWCFAPPQGSLTTLDKDVFVPTNVSMPWAFYLIDPDEDLNWIYNRVFTEGDNINKASPTGKKSSEGINYANGLLMSRQTQKYNSSENTNIVSQTEIDYSGRAALATMPVPVSGNLNGYKLGFVKNSTGNLYTAAMFDADSKVTSPDKIDTTGAYMYYTNASTLGNGINNDNVAHAQGYPFKRTLYKTDGTNRVTEESGVGRVHALGTQSLGMGRTTRILYGTPSDEELIRIFGDEAPLAESVIKTITIDQNNVMSVTYTSKEGKTIATALMTDTVDNVLPLKKTASVLTVTNSINENISTNGKLVSSKRIAVQKDNTVLKLNYVKEALPGGGAGCPTPNCNFRMRFYLIDLKQNFTYVSDADNVAGITNFTPTTGFTFPSGWRLINSDGTSPSTITPGGAGNNEITLSSGEYIFVKEIFSGNSANYADSMVNVENDKTKPIIDAIATRMQNVNSTNAYATFTVYVNNVIALLNNYNSGSPTVTTNQILDTLKIDPSDLPMGYTFPASADFSLSAIASNTADPTQDNFSLTTGCCGALTVPIPKPPICYLCDGSPESVYQGTASIATMTAANQSAGVNDITPYGFNDFKSNGSWSGLSASQKRDAIYKLVDREMIYPFKQKMADEGMDSSATGDLWKIAPGFNFHSLNYMFSNMLISQYYTGAVVQHSGTAYAATYSASTGGYTLTTPIASLSPDYNYDCKNLFEAWYGAYTLLASFEVGGNDNVLTAFNEQDGNGAGENFAEDEDNWEGMSKRRKKKLKKAISQELEDFNGSEGGTVKTERKESATSVINKFMDQAGFQFAAVIDGQALSTHISSVGAVYPDDYAAFGTAPSNSASSIYTTISTGTVSNSYVPLLFSVNNGTPQLSTSTCSSTTMYELYYPYIVRPEWMFKYYTYNVFNDSYINDASTLLPNQVLVDVMRLYNMPISYVSTTVSSTSICSTPSSLTYSIGASTYTFNYLHGNWTNAERLDFYGLVKGSPKCPYDKGVDVGDTLYSGTDLPTCATKAELKTQAQNICTDLLSLCDSRAEIIKSALRNELESSCYTVVPCNPTAGQVTEKQIKIMTDSVIAQAKRQVQYVKNKIDAIGTATNLTACTDPSLTTQNYSTLLCDLPSCWQKDCYEVSLYKNNTTGLISSRKLDMKLFADCDQKILDMIEQGTFLPYVAPLDGCTKPSKAWRDVSCSPETSCGSEYSEKITCPASSFKSYSKTFTVSSN